MKTYWSKKAYDRWLSGLDPQDMALDEAWTSDVKKAAHLKDNKMPPLPAECAIENGMLVIKKKPARKNEAVE